VTSTPSLRVFHFPTNGWFTRRVVEACERVRTLRPSLDLIVTVSIDGPEEVHDRVRGMPGSFSRALDTYRALSALDIDTYVGTTITPFNVDAIDALERTLHGELPGFEPRRWHWNLLQISEHFFANSHLAALPRARPEYLVRDHVRRRGFPKSWVEAMELLFLVNLDFYERGEPSNIQCQSLHSACFISPEGDVHPCHVYDRPLGNVREESLAEIWDSEETRRARVDIERLACGGCFTPCEAYPALAGAPVQTLAQTTRRAFRFVTEQFAGTRSSTRSPGDAPERLISEASLLKSR